MDAKETFQTQDRREIMLYNSAYYKYIFKKTEKIVCALFYILKESDKSHNSIVVDSLKSISKKTLDEVISTLPYSLKGVQERIRGLVISYVALQSSIRLAQADTLIDTTVADTFCLEIDLVLKGLRNYMISDTYNPLDLSVGDVATVLNDAPQHVPSRNRVAPLPFSRETRPMIGDSDNKGQITPRRQAIKDILEAHKNATIKDISQRINDCSEKTLQRELISMIKDGLVQKEGERRWSRYSLV